MAIMYKDLVNPPVNSIVIFNHVLTNVGNAYHPDNGTFIAPVSGTYSFTMNLAVPRAVGDHRMYVFMEKNGADIGYLFSDNTMRNILGEKIRHCYRTLEHRRQSLPEERGWKCIAYPCWT